MSDILDKCLTFFSLSLSSPFHTRAALDRSPRQVAQALARLIEDKGLRIGDRLPPEVELALRFGIGRSTMRETLRQWESLGIIARNKGGGTRILTEV